MVNRYYYNKLSNKERIAYGELYDGLTKHKEKFRVTAMDSELLSNICEFLLLDNPRIFHVSNFSVERRGWNPEYVTIKPKYRFSPNVCETIQKNIDQIVAPLIKEGRCKTDFEKEQLIHDFLVSRGAYRDENADYSHEMYGPFLYGVGVCEGMAKAFKFMADEMGLETIIATGVIKKKKEQHAWNIVSVAGDFYNVDVSFDANLSMKIGTLRYDYFNLPDVELRDRITQYGLPVCKIDYFVYKRLGLYAESKKALMKILKECKKKTVTVQIPIQDCPKNEITDYILDTALDCCKWNIFVERSVSVYPNFHRNVYTIKYD